MAKYVISFMIFLTFLACQKTATEEVIEIPLIPLLPTLSQVSKNSVAEFITSDLINNEGSVIGEVLVRQTYTGVLIKVSASDLPPGPHGAHLHGVGDISDSKEGFKLSGEHIHEEGYSVHGFLNADGVSHEADLPNLYVDDNGNLNVEIFRPGVSIKDNALLPLLDEDGSALIIHANPDDYLTQPIGGAGVRIAGATFTKE